MALRKKNALLAPMIAVVVSGGVGVFLFSIVNSEDTKAVVPPPVQIIKEAPTVRILVANQNILIGKKISADDLSWRAWPESLLNSEYITDNEKTDQLDIFIGGIAKMAIVSGEPIIATKIVQPGDRGAMAILLRKGMRAVSIPVSAASGAGGFILPGDFVDIIVTTALNKESLLEGEDEEQKRTKPALGSYLQLKAFVDKARIDKEQDTNIDNAENNIVDADNQEYDKNNTVSASPEGNQKVVSKQISENKLIEKIANEDELLVASSTQVSELMLENVRVLAIDQSVNKTSIKQEDSEKPQEASSILGATATLEVTPEQAKILALASNGFTLTLSLRSFGETLSDEDGLAVAERLPLTKTVLGLPINKILAGSQGDEEAEVVEEPVQSSYSQESNSNTLQLIRNGRVSVLTPPTSSNNTKNLGDN
jgi:Flp pilus assembly protein CpaB